MNISLREVRDSDLPVFFGQLNDPVANRMAAFTHEDPAHRGHFATHWARIRGNPEVTVRTVVGADPLGPEGADEIIIGHAAVFGPPEQREVTYWIGREHWGHGLASAALRALLALVPDRPLHARAAADNTGSIRVLEKCGFVVTGHDKGFANARGEEIDEVVLTLPV
ncbi:GNAT family protein [Streptomyces sp. NPDC051219]|uniref:GNAT family N-acetyltransferase n=1 Tax=Streptomyces sp. NPDC051219 TaxID=3155283 RepID=UPI003415AF60